MRDRFMRRECCTRSCPQKQTPGSVLLLLGAILAAASSGAAAQDLEPRTYANTPVGLNFLIVGYSYSHGGLATDPSLPLQDADLRVYAGVLAYARSLGVLGKSAKVDVILPMARISGSATYAGEPRERDISGAGDPRFRFSYIFYGAPALSLKEFDDYEQDVIVGASVQVSAPMGQYDSNKLVNVGTNRWSVKPEIGVSKELGKLTLELDSGLHRQRRISRRSHTPAGPHLLGSGTRHLQLPRWHMGGVGRNLLHGRANYCRWRAGKRPPEELARGGNSSPAGEPA